MTKKQKDLAIFLEKFIKSPIFVYMHKKGSDSLLKKQEKINKYSEIPKACI